MDNRAMGFAKALAADGASTIANRGAVTTCNTLSVTVCPLMVHFDVILEADDNDKVLWIVRATPVFGWAVWNMDLASKPNFFNVFLSTDKCG